MHSVYMEVHLTGVAGTAGSTHTHTRPHKMASLLLDGNIDPVVGNIGRDCSTWLALY